MNPATDNSQYNQLEYVIKMLTSKMHTAHLVRVEAADPANLRVQVRIMVWPTDVNKDAVDVNSIYNVPYVRIQAGRNALIIDPEPGDIGLAVFCMRDISSIKATGKESTPGSFRKYSAADAVYIGGLLNAAPERFVRVHEGGVEIEGVTNVTIHAETATVNADKLITLKAPLTMIEGDCFVSGGFGWAGQSFFPDGAEKKLQISAPVYTKETITSEKDITAKGISLPNHRHPYGNGTTGAPQ